MKGMQKISRGKSFSGVMSYVDGEGRGQKIGGNIASEKSVDIAKEFQLARATRPDILKAVWHSSLRLPAGEKIDDTKFNSIATDYMQGMGFSDKHQYSVWKHDDPEGLHIHIVANRISLNGEVFLGQNENLQSTKIIHELEAKHGLTISKGVEIEDGKIVMPDKKRLKSGEVEGALRTGEQPPKLQIQLAINEVLKSNPSTEQFVNQLFEYGITTIPNIASTGTMNGFSFKLNNIKFKASSLGNDYKWQQLKEKLNYDEIPLCQASCRFKKSTLKRRKEDENKPYKWIYRTSIN